jgi:hypothetical protein
MRFGLERTGRLRYRRGMRTIGNVVLVALVALAGCEKDGIPSKASGALAQDESSLLATLPGGNVALFGGNYLRLQDFFQKSAFARLMGDMERMSPGMTTWAECFIDTGGRGLTMMGAISYDGGELVMRYVMKGFGVTEVQACAGKARFETSLDADGKFVSIEMPSAFGPVRTGYLVLPGGALLTRTAMPFPPTTMKPVATTRADLEADVAAAARGNATADTMLTAELARIDRNRAVWFVADASDTPAGDKLGLVRGWIDVDDGISFDLTVQLRDPSLAGEVARGIPELKKQAVMLGDEVGAVVRGLRFERKGDRLRFVLSINSRQLDALVEQMAPFMGSGALGMP